MSKLLACFHQNEALGGGGAESDEPHKSFDQGEVAIFFILEEIVKPTGERRSKQIG